MQYRRQSHHKQPLQAPVVWPHELLENSLSCILFLNHLLQDLSSAVATEILLGPPSWFPNWDMHLL